MSDNESKELIPCVIIKTYDNNSDSDESIILDTTSNEFTNISGDADDFSLIVPSIPSNKNERNDEFHVNNISINSIGTRPNVERTTISNSNDTIIGNVTFFEGPVVIKECIYDYSNTVEETISNDTEPIITDSREVDTCGVVNMSTSSDVKIIHWLRKNQILVQLVAGVILVSATYFTIHIFVSYAQRYEKQRNESAEKFEFSSDYKLTTVEVQFNFKLRVISRSEWQAEKSKSSLMDLLLPSTRVIIAHTVTQPCLTQHLCSTYIKSMQEKHINWGLEDIKYNFLVGGDGAAYVGRGWDKEGAYTHTFNNYGICISFIGTFTENAPPQQQIIAAQKLIEEGVRLKKLIPDYKLYGHRQVSNTLSPGEVLFAIIKEWDHWSDTVI